MLYARQGAEFIDNARLYREIRESDRRKSEFLAMLGHELRNPLAPMLSALHVMNMPGSGESEIQYAREVADRQVRHLARLVDDLLDVSRINNGKIELRKETVDLRDAVRQAVETSRPLVELRRHSLEVAIPDQIIALCADPARLAQVLANLLNNAAKYTEPGGQIRLTARVEDAMAVIRVRDNGIGIDPLLLPYVFDLFTQADRSLDRSQGGLGIGLTLVRRLVELHGGSVGVHSAGAGQGSEFMVRFPLIETPSEAISRPDPDPESGRDSGRRTPRRVLIVDDNADAARMLARILRAEGHEIELAYDGHSALEALFQHPPDVVLLDIGLPGMDGYEVARRVRQNEHLESIVLIALTGYGQSEDRRRALEVGFDDHMVKPVNPDRLTDLIGRDLKARCASG